MRVGLDVAVGRRRKKHEGEEEGRRTKEKEEEQRRRTKKKKKKIDLIRGEREIVGRLCHRNSRIRGLSQPKAKFWGFVATEGKILRVMSKLFFLI